MEICEIISILDWFCPSKSPSTDCLSCWKSRERIVDIGGSQFADFSHESCVYICVPASSSMHSHQGWTVSLISGKKNMFIKESKVIWLVVDIVEEFYISLWKTLNLFYSNNILQSIWLVLLIPGPSWPGGLRLSGSGMDGDPLTPATTQLPVRAVCCGVSPVPRNSSQSHFYFSTAASNSN